MVIGKMRKHSLKPAEIWSERDGNWDNNETFTETVWEMMVGGGNEDKRDGNCKDEQTLDQGALWS